MARLIEYAIPTELSAITELIRRDVNPEDGISAIIAKELYPPTFQIINILNVLHQTAMLQSHVNQ